MIYWQSKTEAFPILRVAFDPWQLARMSESSSCAASAGETEARVSHALSTITVILKPHSKRTFRSDADALRFLQRGKWFMREVRELLMTGPVQKYLYGHYCLPQFEVVVSDFDPRGDADITDADVHVDWETEINCHFYELHSATSSNDVSNLHVEVSHFDETIPIEKLYDTVCSLWTPM